jgi:hypothetical protein
MEPFKFISFLFLFILGLGSCQLRQSENEEKFWDKRKETYDPFQFEISLSSDFYEEESVWSNTPSHHSYKKLVIDAYSGNADSLWELLEHGADIPWDNDAGAGFYAALGAILVRVGDERFSQSIQKISREKRAKYRLLLPYKNNLELNRKSYPKTTQFIMGSA